jgi:hypothetical protein
MIATMMVLMTVRAWLAFPARRQVRRYGGARTNAGCASVLLARLDAMLLSLVCVSFAVVSVFLNGFSLTEETAFQCVLGAPLIVRSHFWPIMTSAYYAHVWRMSSNKFDDDVFSV